MKKIDLHLHSSVSDGTLPPVELIDLAASAGLAAVALTDHDTTAGIPEFIQAAAKHPEILAIPGVEISCMLEHREIHILGLFIEWENLVLGEFLTKIRADRHERNLAVIERLAATGYKVSLEEIQSVSRGEVIGRPHFAKVIKDKYGFNTLQDVFDCCLKRGRPGYCPRRLPSPAETIAAIHAANGIAVWAHPIYRNHNEKSWGRRGLNALAPLGLDGVEAYYTLFNGEQTKILLHLAAEFNLVVSGGSDFHGDNSPGVLPGVGNGGLDIPFSLLEHMIARKKALIQKKEVQYEF